jgi:hypothetical protein
VARIVQHHVQISEAVPIRPLEIPETEEWRLSRSDLLSRIRQPVAGFSGLQDAAGPGNRLDLFPNASFAPVVVGCALGTRKK